MIEPKLAQTRTARVEDAAHASQALLAGLLPSAPDAIISVDAEHHVVLFNPAAEHMLGWPAAKISGTASAIGWRKWCRCSGSHSLWAMTPWIRP